MKLLIVVKDKAARMLVKNQLRAIPGIETILESNSAEDALFQILKEKVNLIIADDSLPARSGFDLANLVREIIPDIPFIVLSDDSDHALEAIRSQVFDFLVYPFSSNKLADSVKKALCAVEEKIVCCPKNQIDNPKIKISTLNGNSLIDLDSLIYCSADGSYTRIFFANGEEEFTCYYLGKIEKILKDYNFIRINRSTVINLKKIKEIDWRKGTCKVQAGSEVIEFRISKVCLNKLGENNLI